MLLAFALVAYEAQSPGKDSIKPPANAASGGTGTPKAPKLRTTSGAELGSRQNSGNRKPRPTRAELPDDPNQIKELTPELAKLLLAKFTGARYLTLNGLTTLDADTARALAEFNGSELELNGLTTLDADTVRALAESKLFRLTLNGLTTLDADTAMALAEFKGALLNLFSLTTLDADTARALAEFKGNLSLDRLNTLDANTAKALEELVGIRKANNNTTKRK